MYAAQPKPYDGAKIGIKIGTAKRFGENVAKTWCGVGKGGTALHGRSDEGQGKDGTKRRFGGTWEGAWTGQTHGERPPSI